jgi:hypothetical protein
VTVSFGEDDESFSENVGYVRRTIVLNRRQGDTIAVDVQTTSWTAQSGTDFVPWIGTIVFGPGDTSFVISIEIIDDLVPETNKPYAERYELFHIWLSNPRRVPPTGRDGAGVMARMVAQAATPQPLPPVLLGDPSHRAMYIQDDDFPQPTIPAEVCVLVLPTATPYTPTPFPTLPLAFPTFRALPPYSQPTLAAGSAITATAALTQAATIIAAWAAPAATVSAWSATQFPAGGAAKGAADAQLLTAEIAKALGWLTLFTMLGGPIAAMLPALFIQVTIRLSRPALRLVRFVRRIFPR